MDGWLVALIVGAAVVVVLIVLQRLGLVDFSDSRRSGGSAGAFAGIEDVFFPTRAEAAQELAREAVLPAPAPIPGDGDRGIYSGSVRIELAPDDGHDRDEEGRGLSGS